MQDHIFASSHFTVADAAVVPAELRKSDLRVLSWFGTVKIESPTREFRSIGNGPAIPVNRMQPGSSYGRDILLKGGRVREIAVFDLDGQIYSAYEDAVNDAVSGKHQTIRIVSCGKHVREEGGGPGTWERDLMSMYRLNHMVMKPVHPGLVCGVRLVEANGSPLLMLNTESDDRMVLAIGNVGNRIEWNRYAPEGYKPEWFHRLLML